MAKRKMVEEEVPAFDEAERSLAAEVNGEGSPEGFRRVNPIDGNRNYFKASAGARAQGVLLGRFKRTDTEEGEDKFYYQIRASAVCENVTQSGDENDVAQPCAVGSIIQIDERAGLRDLEDLVKLAKPQEVVIRSVEKIKLKKGGRTFWRWDVFAREASKRTLASIAEASKEVQEDPFA
jgi:hypothetical protein